MKRKYDEKLVAQIRQNEWTENVEGVEVLVKPIPEGGDSGDMDPRLFHSMKGMPLMMKLMPKPKKNQTILEKVLPLRKMFADYKGIQMVGEGVETKHFLVEGTDLLTRLG